MITFKAGSAPRVPKSGNDLSDEILGRRVEGFRRIQRDRPDLILGINDNVSVFHGGFTPVADCNGAEARSRMLAACRKTPERRGALHEILGLSILSHTTALSKS